MAQHINKYGDVQYIQDALDAGILANPYVALNEYTGKLDFNTLEPTPPPLPPALGYWTDDGEGNYTFSQAGDCNDYSEPVYIGKLKNVYKMENSELVDMDVTLQCQEGVGITLRFDDNNSESSDKPESEFTEPETWETGVLTSLNDSDATVVVDWNRNSFTFHSGSQSYPLTMETTNPPIPEGE